MEVPLSPLALCQRGFDLYPDRTAVLDDGLRITYAELQRRIERLAGALRDLGAGPGDRVALLAPNIPEAFECYTAVPLLGAVLVPLNLRLAPEELIHILDHSEARFLIAHTPLLPGLEPLLGRRPDLRLLTLGGRVPGHPSYEEATAAARPLPFDAEAVDERQLLSINYTSGTTARPKGVRQTHRNNYLNAVDMILALHLGPRDVCLHVAPLFHANGWGLIWGTLAVGAANVMLRKVDPAEIFRRIERYGVTLFGAAATVLTLCLEHARSQRLREVPGRGRVRWLVGGMAPPAEVIRRVEEELGWEVVHLYGLTEVTAFVTRHETTAEEALLDPAERARRKGRQGVPLPLAGRVRVVREDLSDVARNGEELGEVVVRGNVVMEGYHRDPEGTARAFAGGWFHTGDLAVWHPDGQIEVRDRAKDVIVSGGEKIPSLEVEGVLYRHPAVAQVAVVAGPHPLWGETPVAFVVLRRGAEATPEELVRWCRERLPHFKAPTRVELVADLPRSAAGKIQKSLLRQRLLSRRDEAGPAAEAAAAVPRPPSSAGETRA
ncbi:MAG: AMP-binding protein [Bacillota bacterium]|nr:AMP-binding protein [Bacillota bacterium]